MQLLFALETPGSFCERIGVGVASAARKVSVARAVHCKTNAGPHDSQIIDWAKPMKPMHMAHMLVS